MNCRDNFLTHIYTSTAGVKHVCVCESIYHEFKQTALKIDAIANIFKVFGIPRS